MPDTIYITNHGPCHKQIYAKGGLLADPWTRSNDRRIARHSVFKIHQYDDYPAVLDIQGDSYAYGPVIS